MTVVLALIHVFSTNKDFQPVGLYFGTFLIDLTIVENLLL